MDEIMINVYYKLIKANKKTIDEVPENLKNGVQLQLDADINTPTT